MKGILSLLVLFVSFASYSQIENEIEEEVEIPSENESQIKEVLPEFPGGNIAMVKYLSENFKYPKKSRRKNIEGVINVGFTVDKSGEIRDVKILKGVSELLDKEALRVVKNMPNWSPGTQMGKPVSVIYTLPIICKLR